MDLTGAHVMGIWGHTANFDDVENSGSGRGIDNSFLVCTRLSRLRDDEGYPPNSAIPVSLRLVSPAISDTAGVRCPSQHAIRMRCIFWQMVSLSWTTKRAATLMYHANAAAACGTSGTMPFLWPSLVIVLK